MHIKYFVFQERETFNCMFIYVFFILNAQGVEMKEWLKCECSDTQPANYFSTTLFSLLNISLWTARLLEWCMWRKGGKWNKARLSVSWQLRLWSISFCLGISCLQPQPALFLAYPAAHIPIRAFVVDVISSSEEFAHLLCVCARLGLLGSFVLETIPRLAILLQHVVRSPEGVQPRTALTPELRSIQIPCRWGPSSLGATQNVKTMLKEGQFLISRPASAELAPPNSLHATARSFNKPVVKNDPCVQHKVYY